MNDELLVNTTQNEQLIEVSLADLSLIGETIPPGEYICRMTSINPKEGAEGAPGAVEAVFEVLDGQQEGSEIRVYYSLKVTRSAKNGKLYAKGIQDAMQAAAAVGRPFDPQFRMPLDPTKAAMAIGERLHPTRVPKVRVKVWKETYTATSGEKKGQEVEATRKAVVGAAGSGAPGATASTTVSGPAPSTGNVLDALKLA